MKLFLCFELWTTRFIQKLNWLLDAILKEKINGNCYFLRLSSESGKKSAFLHLRKLHHFKSTTRIYVLYFQLWFGAFDVTSKNQVSLCRKNWNTWSGWMLSSAVLSLSKSDDIQGSVHFIICDVCCCYGCCCSYRSYTAVLLDRRFHTQDQRKI